jgi:hypothetical protein
VVLLPPLIVPVLQPLMVPVVLLPPLMVPVPLPVLLRYCCRH